MNQTMKSVEIDTSGFMEINNPPVAHHGGFKTLWLPSLIATRPPQMHIEAAFEVLPSGRFSGNFS
jgi:hypothetical protein